MGQIGLLRFGQLRLGHCLSHIYPKGEAKRRLSGRILFTAEPFCMNIWEAIGVVVNIGYFIDNPKICFVYSIVLGIFLSIPIIIRFYCQGKSSDTHRVELEESGFQTDYRVTGNRWGVIWQPDGKRKLVGKYHEIIVNPDQSS